MKRNIFGWTLVVLLLTACQTPGPLSSQNTRDLKNYGVTIKIAGNKLKASSKPQGWKKDNKKDGYVGWEQGQSGWVSINLKNEDSGHICGAGGEKDAKWVITEMYLSAFPEVMSEDEKGDFGGRQPVWLKEAFPQVDLSDGSVFKAADKSQGVTFLSIANANGQEGEKFIYYSVTVEKCDQNVKIKLDPGFNNGGK